MKTLTALLIALLLFVSAAEACTHVPAQALLQGGTCPVCGATAQSVVAQSMINSQSLPQNYSQPAPVVQPVQPVVQYVQQPVQVIQRVVQPQVVQYVQQPQFLNSSYSSFQNVSGGGYSSFNSNVVTTPVILNRGLSLNVNGPFGGGFNAAIGGGFNSNVIVNPAFGFNANFGIGHGGFGAGARFGGGHR